MSRRVSFAASLCEIYCVSRFEASRVGITAFDVEKGKRASKEHRLRYPNLPKFTFFDDDAMAAAVHEAASAAYAAATAEVEDVRPLGSSCITIKPGRRRSSRTSSGDYLSPNPSTRVATAVAAATAAAAAQWRAPVEPQAGPRRLHTWFRRQVDNEHAKEGCHEELSWMGQHDPPRLRLQRYDSVQDAVSRLSCRMPAQLQGYKEL